MFNPMVEHGASTTAAIEDRARRLDQVFGALADPTRRAILARLCEGDASVGQLAAPFDMSFAAVSKHVGVLERAGLVLREARGRERRCHLEAEPLRAAREWTDEYSGFWEDRLDALGALLQEKNTGHRPGGRRPNEAPEPGRSLQRSGRAKKSRRRKR